MVTPPQRNKAQWFRGWLNNSSLGKTGAIFCLLFAISFSVAPTASGQAQPAPAPRIANELQNAGQQQYPSEVSASAPAPTPAPTPALAPAPEPASDLMVSPATPSVSPEMLQRMADGTAPLLPALELPQSSKTVQAESDVYTTEFSSYTLGEIPADWSLYRRNEAAGWPVIIHFGGETTDEYKRLEFPDTAAVDYSESWLIKDEVAYTRAGQVEAHVNFQTEQSGLAGVVVGWKNMDNFAAVLLDQVNDTVWILVYRNGVAAWQNNGIGATHIEAGLDYRIVSFSPEGTERGMGYINVWTNDANGSQLYLYTSQDMIDLRGRMGVGVVNSAGRVTFDSYWAFGVLPVEPLPSWISPGANGAQVDVYGDSVWLSTTTTNPISVWFARYWRFDAVNYQWLAIADYYDFGPYEFYLNTGDLNFGNNEFAIDLYTIDGKWIIGPPLWLNRLRLAETVTVVGDAPATLVADGQSQTQLTVEVRDRGYNLLPGVEVSFGAEKVTLAGATVSTDSNGRATATITAGTVAGAGRITYQAGNVQGEATVTLVAGAPQSMSMTSNQSQMVADSYSSSEIIATVKDAYGNPVPGIPVSFAATLGAIGSSAVTDSQGQAKTQFTAQNIPGIAQLTAGYSTLSANTSIALVVGPPAQLTVSASPAVLYADGASIGDVTARLEDAYGHPLGGHTVYFSTSQGQVDASATTNSMGLAFVKVTSGVAVGPMHVQAVVSGLSSSVDIALAPGPIAALHANASAPEVVADGNSQLIISVAVRDAQNRPVPEARVTFATTSGTITPEAITDQNGIAVASMSPGKLSGRAIITARAANIATELEIEVKSSNRSLYLAFVQNAPPAREPLSQLNNGSFDAGSGVGWVELVDGKPGKLIYQESDNATIPTPVSAPYVAWLGGKASQTNRLYQSVNLPGSDVLFLEYMYYTKSLEQTCGQDSAVLEALVNGNALMLKQIDLCAQNDLTGWRRGSVSLAALRGQSFDLQFRSVLNGTKNSNLFLDDVRICTLNSSLAPEIPVCATQTSAATVSGATR